jgi:hypothetical protein
MLQRNPVDDAFGVDAGCLPDLGHHAQLELAQRVRQRRLGMARFFH